MIRYVPTWAWVAIGAAVLLGIQQVRVLDAKADAATAAKELADYRLEVTERDNRNMAATLAESHRRQAEIEEVQKNAQVQIDAIRADAASAESANRGLLDQIARLRAGRAATCDAIAAQRGQAAGSVASVLADVLESANERAGRLAEEADRYRVAGLACQAAYGALSTR